MTRGFSKPLYLLPFDDRGTFETKMFAIKILSAMRCEFGGHLEKVATKGQAA